MASDAAKLPLNPAAISLRDAAQRFVYCKGKSPQESNSSFWYYTRADQNRFIDCPVRFQANRLKNFFPSKWHREHQIVYVKADLLKVVGRIPGGVAI